MDPASAIVYGIVQDFAVSFVSSLLASYATRPGDALRTARDRQRAEQTLADIVTDSLLPLFPPGMPEPDGRMVATRLGQASKKLTMELLAECEYHAPRVMAAIAAPPDATQDARFQHLDGLFRKALQTVVERYIQIAPSLPEWQRMNWDRGFEIWRRVDDNVRESRTILEEMRDKPGQEAETFEKAFRASVAAKNAYIRLLGVAAPMPVELHLDTAFVDLQLGALHSSEALSGGGDACAIATLEEMRKRVEQQMGERPTHEDDAAGTYLARHPRLVIVGAPGSGKTTLMQRIAHCTAEGQLGELCPDLPADLVPFLFRVRSLDLQNLPAPEEFVSRLTPNLAAAYPSGLVTSLLSGGRAIVMVDGLDECEPAQHQHLMEWIAGLTRDFGESRFLLSSRPAGYTPGELLTCDYAEAELQPLTESQRDDFVKRWYRAAATPVAGGAPERDPADSAADLLGRLARTPSIRFMATNPLLLSVICVVHRYRGEKIPERRADLLKHCVDVLIHEWSSAKPDMPPSLLTELDAAQKTALVRPLAWRMMEEGMAESPRGTAEQVFAEVLPAVAQDPDRAAELLDHIRDQSGLLVEQRPGVFSFAHLVFQEYLASEAAVSVPGGLDELLTHGADPQWRGVLRLYCGLQGASPRALILALLEMGEYMRAGECAASVVALETDVRDKVVENLIARVADIHYLSRVLARMPDPSLHEKCLDAILACPISAHQLVENGIVRAVAEMTTSGEAPTVERTVRLLHERLPLAIESAVAQARGRCEFEVSAVADFAVLEASMAGFLGWVHDSARGAPLSSPESRSLAEPRPELRIDVGVMCGAAANSAAGTDTGAPSKLRFVFQDSVTGLPADACTALAAVLEALEPIASGPSVREHVFGGKLTAEHTVYLWGPLAEALDSSEAATALEAIAGLPGDVFPLLRLCVLRRLEHRWEGQLAEAEQARLAELIAQAEDDVGAHFRTFAERVAEEMRQRA